MSKIAASMDRMFLNCSTSLIQIVEGSVMPTSDFLNDLVHNERLCLRGKLDPDELRNLEQRLESNYGISDRARQYVVERICLPQCSLPSSCDRVLDYLSAIGRQLIDGSRDLSSCDNARHEALESILEKMKAEGKKRRPIHDIDVFNLLKEDLERNRALRTIKSHTDLANSVQGIQTHGSLVRLPAEGTLHVVGDLHGDAQTAKELSARFCEQLGQSTGEQLYVVFLGDYVNNGLRSVDTLIELLTLRSKYPDNIVLLSGNHEFAETYATALNELLVTHWMQWVEFTSAKNRGFKTPPEHYGHIRIELARRYGIEIGEAIYRKFAEWGRSLPFVALSDKGILMSHSLGLPLTGKDSLTCYPALHDFITAKINPEDVACLNRVGYEAWKKSCSTLHARMVNNRNITRSTIEAFRRVFQNRAKVFIVGHTHYRSGDRDLTERNRIRRAKSNEPAVLCTLCSSHPQSPHAGHYIAFEFGGSRSKEADTYGRDGEAYACIAVFKAERVESISDDDIRMLDAIGVRGQKSTRSN